MKILRILLAVGMLLPLSLPAQKSKIEDEVALLAARGDLERLRPLYDSVRQSLSPHTALYCRFAMARGAGHHREVIALIDSLERFHERKLDVRGLLALATERCEAHVALGEYTELKSYCDERLSWAQRRSVRQSRRGTLRFYQSLGKEWGSVPAPTEEWRSESFSVPLSRDWPLLIPARIGSSDFLPFLLDTGHHHTLISQSDAETWGVEALTETLFILTADGWVNARPAILPTLSIGELTLSNIPVFVVDETIDAPFSRSLGTDVLHRLQHLVFSDAALLISNTAPSFSPINETLALSFSTDGGLNLQTMGTSASSLMPFELALPDSLTTAENLLRRTEFLRSATQTHLDFSTMQLKRQKLRANYRPRTVSDYLAANDYFGLLNNEISLTYTASPEEVSRMTSVLNRSLEPALPLSIPQGLPNTIQPLTVQPPLQPTVLPYLGGEAQRLVTLQLSQQPLSADLNPLHLISQISSNAVRRHKLNVYKGAQGRQWALVPELRVGEAVVSNLLCLVVNAQGEGVTLGLDVLSRMPALTFGSESITVHPLRQSDPLPFERLFVVTPAGLIVQDATQEQTFSRPLRLSDYQGKTIDFEQMSIR